MPYARIDRSSTTLNSFNRTHPSANKGPMSSSRRIKLLLSYAPDWWAWLLPRLSFSHPSTSRIITIALAYVYLGKVPTLPLSICYTVSHSFCSTRSMALGEIFHWKTHRMSYLISIYTSITDESLKGYATRTFYLLFSELPSRSYFLYISFAVHERVPVCWCCTLVSDHKAHHRISRISLCTW